MTQPSPLAQPLPWDLVAPAYADEVVPVFEHFSREALRLVAPAKGSRIVDVACGPGTLAVLAAQQAFTVDALDFSPEMIGRLEARKGALSITPHVGDGQALPYADGTFAGGFSMFGLMFFPDRAKGFAELRRVLAPGARAAVSSWPSASEVPVLDAMWGAVREATGQTGPSAPPPLSSEDVCRSEMSTAFRDVVVHRVVHTQTAPSADYLWEMFARTTAPLVLMRQRMGAKWDVLADACRTAIRRVAGEGPVEMAMPAIVAVGTA